jgi:hypothetical protein
LTRGRVAGAVVLLVVAVALGVWVARNTTWAEVTIPSPFKGEARTNPFYAAERLARELGADATTDRTFVAPPADAMLVLSRVRWGLSASRQHALQTWVEQGGRLVVDVTVIDDVAFRNWSGVVRKRIIRTDGETPRDEPPPSARCRPLEPWPQGRSTSTPLQLCDDGGFSYLESSNTPRWELRDSSGAQVIRVPAGRGSITAVNSFPFTNDDLLADANAALFVASTRLQTGDAVRFLTEADYPSLLALLWLRAWPIVTIALALTGAWIWRSAARFGPPAPPDRVSRRSLEEQIRGTGEFARRHGGSDALLGATRRALDDVARRRVTGYARLTTGERAARLAALSGLPQDALLAALSENAARTSRTLDALHTLETARRQLLSAHTRT